MRSKVRHTMAVCAVLLGLTAGVPAWAQSQTDREMSKAQSELAMAEAALASAQAADAAVLAKPLYDEATAQVRQARGKWNDTQHGMREDAILRAVEARHAARAAEAQAALISANNEIRNLRTDIGNFGGTAPVVTLYEPPANISRGMTSLERVIVAENALKTARAAGGDMVAGEELKQAEATLKTARLLAKNRKQNESADHLAYLAEMQARRAEFVARRNAVWPQLASLRSERTRLAQLAVETRARDEQNRRLEVERQAVELRRQLEAESVNRQAEQAELERLRQQVAQNELQLRSRLDEDRAARVAAEQNYDNLMQRYQASLVEGSATSIEAEQLRRLDAGGASLDQRGLIALHQIVVVLLGRNARSAVFIDRGARLQLVLRHPAAAAVPLGLFRLTVHRLRFELPAQFHRLPLHFQAPVLLIAERGFPRPAAPDAYARCATTPACGCAAFRRAADSARRACISAR